MPQVRTSLFVSAVFLPVAIEALAQTAKEPASYERPVFVQSLVLPAQRHVMSRQFFGQVAAYETVDISFEVGGYLEFLKAREGTRIPRGTRLASLDLVPFKRAVERAELSLTQAERALTRAQTLAERSVTSAVQAERAETARDLAEVSLREANEALADAQIFAPFDALVADRLGAAFTTIQPGDPVLRLHNMTETRVEFDLPERLLAAIEDPSQVTFVGHIAGSETEIPLSFQEFRAETSGIGQSYTVSLAVTGETRLALLPGRTITVIAHIPEDEPGIQVPATAIVTQPNGARTVAVLRHGADDITATHVPVEVTSTSGTSFTIVGLEPADEIISVGAHLIADGQSVKRFEGLTVEGF